MHLLPSAFIECFAEIVNVHPAFLPLDSRADEVVQPDGRTMAAFRGGHAVRDAPPTRAVWSSASVHRVTAQADRGEIVVRAPFRLDGLTTVYDVVAACACNWPWSLPLAEKRVVSGLPSGFRRRPPTNLSFRIGTLSTAQSAYPGTATAATPRRIADVRPDRWDRQTVGVKSSKSACSVRPLGATMGASQIATRLISGYTRRRPSQRTNDMFLTRTISRLVVYASALSFAAAISVSTIAPASADCEFYLEGNFGTGMWVCPPGQSQGNAAPAYQDKYAAVALTKDARHWGYSYGYASLDDAERVALTKCRPLGSGCWIANWGKNLCIAVAVSLPDRTSGWESDNSRRAAGQKAVAACRGADGKNCRVAVALCADD